MDNTKVIFRKWKDTQDIIALFPYEPGNGQADSCSSYMHVGQHGSADYSHVVNATVKATPNEYDALKRELQELGYHLDIRTKKVLNPANC